MSTYSTYNFKDHFLGDTFDAVTMTYSVDGTPVDLSGVGVEINMWWRYGSPTGTVSKEFSIGSGITLTDGANGEFQIDDFVIDLDVGVHYFDIEFYVDGSRKTRLKGTIKILQDVTQPA